MKKKFLLILSFSMLLLNNKELVSYALDESSNDVEEDISNIEIPPEGALYEYDMTPATNSLLGDYVLLSTSIVENKPNYVKHKLKIYEYTNEVCLVMNTLSGKYYPSENNSNYTISKSFSNDVTKTISHEITNNINTSISSTIGVEADTTLGFPFAQASFKLKAEISSEVGCSLSETNLESKSFTYEAGETYSYSINATAGYYYCLEERVHCKVMAYVEYDFYPRRGGFCLEKETHYQITNLDYTPFLTIGKYQYAGNGKYNYVGETDGTIFISSSGYNSL